jgi:hypothetical protein
MSGAGDYYPYGQEMHMNPIYVDTVWGDRERPYPKMNVTNSWIENVQSDRRNTGNGPQDFMIELKNCYKGVSMINLLNAKIPISDEVIALGSFFLFIKANNDDLCNIYVSGKCDDSFSLDGAYAHILVDGDPTIVSQFKQYPRLYRFGTPIDNLQRLDISFYIVPDDPLTQTRKEMPFDEDTNVEFDFEIVAQSILAAKKTTFT